MNLDRGMIKQQANMLIKGKCFKLFLTYFIITLCVSSLNIVGNAFVTFTEGVQTFKDIYSDEYNNDTSDKDYFKDFTYESGGDDFQNFGTANNGGAAVTPASDYEIDLDGENQASKKETINKIGVYLSRIGNAAAAVFAPLSITLAAFMVEFVNGKEYEFGNGVAHIFKASFNKTFSKKLCLNLIQYMLSMLLTFLFVVPGIMFTYASRFAPQILCENPELSPMQALKLSWKITKGHRMELFVLDLSFIPLLLTCAFIIPVIYVIPYYEVTNALYYENFRMRALEFGGVREDDFLSDLQKWNKYAGGMNGAANQYYAPYGANANGVPYNANVNYGGFTQQAYSNPAQPYGVPVQPVQSYGNPAPQQFNQNPAAQYAAFNQPVRQQSYPYAVNPYFKAAKPAYFVPKRADEVPGFQPGYVNQPNTNGAAVQNENSGEIKADFNETNIAGEESASAEKTAPVQENAVIYENAQSVNSAAEMQSAEESAEKPAQE